MFDTLIRNGTMVDGTGAAGIQKDVGLRDGRIAAIGALREEAARVVDAGGLVVAPGFVDPHTHYDAQLFWDPFASPSSLHGVTTVIAGNCGFTLAPLRRGDADYLRRMMAVVEGMPLEALEAGLDWDWESFSDYLGRLDGKVGVNVGFLVGHCALRRSVMGSDAVGKQATPEQLGRMVRLLHESIAAGGLGFSSSLSFTHSDGDGQPVPSRSASREEVLALCAALAEHEGTALEFITDGCLTGFSDDEIALMAEMSLAARRPLNWNVLSIDASEEERVLSQLGASEAAAQRGARVVALTMPILPRMTMSFLSYSAIFNLPDWGPILGLPLPERMAKLADPETRRFMAERAASPEAGVFSRVADWAHYEIGETFSPENVGLQGRIVADIAAERGKPALDTLLDIALADELRTVLWPLPPDDDDASWELRGRAWRSDDVVFGGSDAGAHLDRMCGAPYPTEFLADCLGGRRMLSLEQAVHAMTDVPARLLGLRERGRIAEGYHADLVLFDAASVGSEAVRTVRDLPGDSERLFAGATGIHSVWVNGREIVAEGAYTGELPGTLLRPGRDTRSVGIPGASRGE